MSHVVEGFHTGGQGFPYLDPLVGRRGSKTVDASKLIGRWEHRKFGVRTVSVQEREGELSKESCVV